MKNNDPPLMPIERVSEKRSGMHCSRSVLTQVLRQTKKSYPMQREGDAYGVVLAGFEELLSVLFESIGLF